MSNPRTLLCAALGGVALLALSAPVTAIPVGVNGSTMVVEAAGGASTADKLNAALAASLSQSAPVSGLSVSESLGVSVAAGGMRAASLALLNTGPRAGVQLIDDEMVSILIDDGLDSVDLAAIGTGGSENGSNGRPKSGKVRALAQYN